MRTPTKNQTPKSVTLKADPALSKKWQSLLSQVHAHEKKSAEDWDHEWEAVGQILSHEPPLYVVGGYKTAAEFFEKELRVNERVGRAYVRVAEHASAKDEVALGVWRLDAALGYVEATHGALKKRAQVDFARMKIAGKALASCTVPFIKSQTRSARSGGKKAATHYRDALEAKLSGHAAFKSVRVREANGKVSFDGVPNASLKTFAEVLLATKLPDAVPSKKSRRA